MGGEERVLVLGEALYFCNSDQEQWGHDSLSWCPGSIYLKEVSF